MSTNEIYNFRRVNDHIGTGGQPTEDQIRDAAAEGFKTVINLATLGGQNSLDDEAGLVQSLGMGYHHIPVKWDNPKESDFDAFEATLSQITAQPDHKVLIHCAANFRVTAFYSLFALKNLGWTDQEAIAFRETIWQGSDYPIWEAYIAQMTKRITGR